METILKIEEFELPSIAGFEVTTSHQVIRLYIDTDISCCEHIGYFWCNEDPQEFVGAELKQLALTDTELNCAQMEAHYPNLHNKYFEGGILFVNLETSKGTLQFVTYNEHNGYYGHEATVESEQLAHVTVI